MNVGGLLYMEKIKVKPKKGAKQEKTVINFFVKTQIFALIVYIVLFVISSIIALLVDSPDKNDSVIIISVMSFASLITGFYAGMKIRSNGLVVGIIYSLPINALVLIISLIAGNFAIGINFFVSLFALVISSAIGGIIAVNKRLK